jgi:hypothetical protein
MAGVFLGTHPDTGDRAPVRPGTSWIMTTLSIEVRNHRVTASAECTRSLVRDMLS